MTPKHLLRIAISACLACIALPAFAAGKDATALKKIDEALSEHYPAEKYDKAERALKAALQTCGKKACSKEVMGKIHVGFGIVRGKSSRNLTGARKAFEQAKKADPNATLDPKVVTPPVAKDVVVEFYKVMGRDLPAEFARSSGPVGNLRCVPASNYEIQTAQPIAVVCDPLEGAVRAELHYRFDGETKYTDLLMSVQDGTFRANIPCESLAKPGTLDVYIVAEDFNNEKIDNFGTSTAPAHYKIVKSTQAPVPSYPGQDPPKRCSELLVGGGALGESCAAAKPCKRGLYCAEGLCQKAPACETNSECESDHCNNGYCEMEDTEPEVVVPVTRHWIIGLHGAADLWLTTGWSHVCGEQSLRAGDFHCYNRGQDSLEYNEASLVTNHLPMTDPSSSGNIASGFRVATIRVMASVDYVLRDNLTIGTRLGWAFNGGPRAIHYNSEGRPSRKAAFIPVHAEARGTYWLRPTTKPGFHPLAHVSAGLAEVDANTPINARLQGFSRKLDAWRKLGPFFGGVGIGVLYSIGSRYGVLLDANAMVMLPTMGLVIEPSLGGVMAF